MEAKHGSSEVTVKLMCVLQRQGVKTARQNESFAEKLDWHVDGRIVVGYGSKLNGDQDIEKREGGMECGEDFKI